MGPTPYFSTAPLKWLVGQGMKMMGVDSAGVELADDKTHSNVNHLVLFRAGIPVIENLANLNRVSRPRVKVYALPVPVRGLDAFPLRVIAVE
jgi:arylformamidase